MKQKKSWNQKIATGRPHQVKRIEKNFADLKAGQKVLIPSARLVDAAIRELPPGSSMPPKELRQQLAEQNGAEATCPVTFGIQLRTVAEATFESFEEGVELDELAPVWRVLDETAPTVKKLSYDVSFLMQQRAQEGL